VFIIAEEWVSYTWEARGKRKLKSLTCERERVVEREVCTNRPFLEFLWCDDNLRTCMGYGTVETA
jgi:hypothetical protein